ncbi:hypothetical protein TNCV_1836051 [Trichonephila clavipes]|nr:hypothetical protein TNCV_1836051 [Trichonephila clavipes]
MQTSFLVCVAPKGPFQPRSGKRKEKEEIVSEIDKFRTLTEENIDAFQPKRQLVEKDVLMPVKHNVFLWNLLPGCRRGAFMMEKTVWFRKNYDMFNSIYLSERSPCLFWFLYVSDSPSPFHGNTCCGQRTVRMAVVACSQKRKAVFAAQAQLINQELKNF